MPYQKTAELPTPVQKLPARAQKIFLKVFNAVLKRYGKEDAAFAIAWTAVRRAGYAKKS